MNYIKIKKGTFEAFNKLASKDPETIYFIVDPTTNKSAIYIGNIPVVGENAINNFNLTKLNDVKMNELKDGYVLTYNAKSKTWEGQEPLIGAIISQSSDSSEIEELKKENQLLKNQLEELNKELSIQTKNIKTLFANVAKLNQSSSGNATAIAQMINSLSDEVKTIQEKSKSFVLTDQISDCCKNKDYYSKQEIDEQFQKSNYKNQNLERKIFEDLDEATIFIKAHEDEYKNFIYLIPTGLSEDDNKYYEYLCFGFTDFNEPILNKVGSWEVDLASYLTKEQFNSQIELLHKKLDNCLLMEEYQKDKELLDVLLINNQWSELEGE